MRNTTLHNQLDVSVLYSAEEVAADIRDRRPDSLAHFGELDEAQRDQLVADAWMIGLRALRNAYTNAQESKLEDIGATLVADFDQHLRDHVAEQQRTITAVLAQYFDPNDGQVTQRLAAFVADHGVLARQLEKYVGPANSVLAEELSRRVGESSPLFKMLSPTDSQGLVKVLEGHLQEIMHQGHNELVRALDPLAEDGAVARFLRHLRTELKAADKDREHQLSSVLASLDANDENSLLSRLVRETNAARQDVLKAINPDAPETPFGILKASLTGLLEEQRKQLASEAGLQKERFGALEKMVAEALARIETRKSSQLKSPRGGLDFEDEVLRFIAAATAGAPCVFDATANTSGVMGRSKKGDAVLAFIEGSAYTGCRVVFEAKREAGYTAQSALDELDAARKNRDAVAGVFIMARSHAQDAFPRFGRYGNNVLVVWDEEDPSTDAYLQAAILLGTALVARTKPVGDEGDIAALQDVESRIEAELNRLAKMEKQNEAIRKNSDGLGEEIRKARTGFGRLLARAQDTLRALKVEAHDEQAERESPITLGWESAPEAFVPNGLLRKP